MPDDTGNPNPNPNPTPAPQTPQGGSPNPSPQGVPNTPATNTPPSPPGPAQEAPGTANSGPRRVRDDGTSDAIPDGDVLEMSRDALKARLARSNKAQLKQLFGTDSPEEILAWRDQAAAAKENEEKRRLAEMTEAQRATELANKHRAEAEMWRKKHDELQESFAMREQDAKMQSVARKFIHPETVDFVMEKFASHLIGIEDVSTIGSPATYAENFFKKYAEDFPRFARDLSPEEQAAKAAAAATPAAGMTQAAPAPRQVPITNAPNVTRPNNVPANGGAIGKTFAPGQANSMSDAEARAEMRKQGYDF